MVDTYVYATSAALGLAIRYTQETVGGSSVFTDMGKITDMSSPGTVWAITSTPSGGVGLVSMLSGQATITGGIQVSGTVNVSGPVAVQSGGTLPVSLVSANVGIFVTSGGVIPISQVSTSLANFSGLILGSGVTLASGQFQNLAFDASASVWRPIITLTSTAANPVPRFGGLSGDFPMSQVSIISSPVAISVGVVSATVSNFSGLFLASGLSLASGLWLASGIAIVDNMQVNNSANVDTFIGLGSASMPVPVRLYGNYRNVSTGVISVTCSAGAGVNMSGDYLLLSAGNTSTKFRVNYIQFFNAGTTSSQLTGLAWTSATGGSYFRTFLQPQQGWNANLVGANFVGSAGAALYATLATVSGTPVDVTVIYDIIPGSWVEGANT